MCAVHSCTLSTCESSIYCRSTWPTSRMTCSTEGAEAGRVTLGYYRNQWEGSMDGGCLGLKQVAHHLYHTLARKGCNLPLAFHVGYPKSPRYSGWDAFLKRYVPARQLRLIAVWCVLLQRCCFQVVFLYHFTIEIKEGNAWPSI